jgi:endonuclease/exonuclease/phosphatase family metal-dependent hydrolase
MKKPLGFVRFAVLHCMIYIFTMGLPAYPGNNPKTITICTFNIQNFGKTKLNDPVRIKVLAGIIRKYDIVAVQEISDVTNTLCREFVNKINDNGQFHYEYLCSESTGKQPDDKSSREQYAFFYNAGRVTPSGEPALYNDSLHDYFAREPYTARFKTKTGKFTFVLVTVHTAPDEAVKEIGSLDEVVKWARTRYASETKIIVMGDFNASCSYAKPAELDQLSIRGSNYFWVVPDSANTNLSEKTDCAYDRFVLTLPAKSFYTGHWGIDHSFTTKDISDHWPVWAEFKVTKK